MTDTGHYADIHGTRLYYEIHGEQHGPDTGMPLVLLHGGGSSIDVTFGRILPHLSRARRVIALDERAHGRSGDTAEPLRFESAADDVAALLDALAVEQADVFGFSNGASTALQVAIRHPARVRKLVFASSMTRRDGAIPQLWDFIGQGSFDTMPQPLKDAFLAINPDETALRTMHDKDRERMLQFADVPDIDVAGLQAQTLVLLGDLDIVTIEHALWLSRTIPAARLMILPGGHGDYLGELLSWVPGSDYPALTAGLVEAFLDGE